MNTGRQLGVVTGATSGIGKAIALAFAGLGMSLCLVGRDQERLEEIAGATRALSVPVVAYQADLQCDEDIRRVVSGVQNDLGALDVLVHSAGLFRMGSVEQAPVAELDLLYRTNVRAPYALTQALLPMIRARSGQIVFINSSAGLVARPNVASVRASTRHTLKAIADLAPRRGQWLRRAGHYRVSGPQHTLAPQQQSIHQQEGQPYRPQQLLQPEDVAKAVMNALSMPRTAEVTDISIRPMQKA